MLIASSYPVLFRDRPDGSWDYFPGGHKGPGYHVDAAQRDRLLRLLRYERLCYVVAVAVILVIFALMIGLMIMRMLDSWFMAWSPLAMPALWFVLLSPISLLKSGRRRLLRDAPPAQDAVTLEEFRYRTADILSAPRILSWFLFFVALAACALAVAYAGFVFDNLLMLAGGAGLTCIYGRNVWHWVQVYRGRCTLLRSRQAVPLVFD